MPFNTGLLLNGKNVARDRENASFLWGVTVRTDVESVGSAFIKGVAQFNLGCPN
jgi:hypothetical protein